MLVKMNLFPEKGGDSVLVSLTVAYCSGGVFCEAGFDEFADEGGGKWFFGMEADGAFAGVVVLEEVAVGLGDGARHVVEGTLVFWCRRRRSK